MDVCVLTLFPEMLQVGFRGGVISRAIKKGVLKIRIMNIRDYSDRPHRKVDDYPYGGGPGMVIRPEPLHNAIVDAKPGCVVYLTPQGRLFDHEVAKDLSRMDKLILLCGHYEGIDERIRECFVDDEISIGDYVLSCGEIPCLVVLDAVVRFLPGVLGDQDSVEKDSFSKHLLDYPSYTRPRNFQGLSVPPVLLSGHHNRIQEWRRQEALRRTFLRRPDLLEKIELSEEDVRFLKSLRRS